jgi:hypothetical protein
MDIDKILNLALNKALIGKDRIKQVNSNEIADFVNKHLEAINYTRCCEELRENNKPIDGGTSYATLGRTKGKSDM